MSGISCLGVARIWQEDRALGSGVFLSSHCVLTCQHVVDAADPGSVLRVNIANSDMMASPVKDIRGFGADINTHPSQDLALVFLERGIPDARILAWAPGNLDPHDEVIVLGYRNAAPKSELERAPCHVSNIEGNTGLIQLSGGATEGFSGAPLVKEVNGEFCAVGINVRVGYAHPQRTKVIPRPAIERLLAETDVSLPRLTSSDPKASDLQDHPAFETRPSRYLEIYIATVKERIAEARELRLGLGRIGVIAYLSPDEIDPALVPSKALMSRNFDAIVAIVDTQAEASPPELRALLEGLSPAEHEARCTWIPYGRPTHIIGGLPDLAQWSDNAQFVGRCLDSADSAEQWAESIARTLFAQPDIRNAGALGLYLDQRGSSWRVGRPRSLEGSAFLDEPGPLLVVRPDDGLRQTHDLMTPSSWQELNKSLDQVLGLIEIGRPLTLSVRSECQLSAAGLLGVKLNRTHGNLRLRIFHHKAPECLDVNMDAHMVPKPLDGADTALPGLEFAEPTGGQLTLVLMPDDATRLDRVRAHAQATHRKSVRHIFVPKVVTSVAQIEEVAGEISGACERWKAYALEIYTTWPTHALIVLFGLLSPHPVANWSFLDYNPASTEAASYVPFSLATRMGD